MARKKTIDDFLKPAMAKKPKRYFQCAVDQDFHEEVHAALRKKKLSAQEVIEASLKAFVANA